MGNRFSAFPSAAAGACLALGVVALLATGCDLQPAPPTPAAASKPPALPTTSASALKVMSTATETINELNARLQAAQNSPNQARPERLAKGNKADPLQPVPPSPVGELPAEHYVPPTAAQELARKRAEWQEHVRQTEQQENEMQAWRKGRHTDDAATPTPRLGAAPISAPATPAEAADAALVAWHRNYWSQSAAVRLALNQLGMALAANPRYPPQMTRACQDLAAAVNSVTADPHNLAAPRQTLARDLTTAYAEMHAASIACLQEREDEQSAHLAAAGQAMKAAAAELRPYHLQP